MASINREPNGRRTIRFMSADGKRKSIRLGKVNQRLADEIKVKVEALNAAAIAGCSIDNETAQWVARIGDDLHQKLTAIDLLQGRASCPTLAEFTGEYITARAEVKPSTRCNLEVCKARLIEFFGANRKLSDVTPGDCDSFLTWLKTQGASSTAGRTVRRARQFFRAAHRRKLVSENPFADVKAPGESNDKRKYFITLEDAQKVLDACPDAEWRLIFALSRFGGLRTPSEHLGLKWSDVDWERGRFLVHAPKTEHHANGGERWVPIFPELKTHLEESFDLAETGTVYVIDRYRRAGVNLGTQLHRIIRRAGLTPWPKTFQNLRASRETELAAEYPLHVVCAWIGNTPTVALRHYLQVRDEDFQRAAKSAAGSAAKSGAVSAKAVQNPVQQTAVPNRKSILKPLHHQGLCERMRAVAKWC